MMSDSITEMHADALFVIACPVCQGEVAATGSLCGRDAFCPLCATLFHIPFPPAASSAAAPEKAPTDLERSGLAEDWGSVISQLAPPQAEPVAEPVAAPVVPAGEKTLGADRGVASAPPAAALPTTGGTPLDPSAEELLFQEPVRTVRYGDTVVEIRRLSPEERRIRRFRRNLLMIIVGVSILLAIVLLNL